MLTVSSWAKPLPLLSFNVDSTLGFVDSQWWPIQGDSVLFRLSVFVKLSMLKVTSSQGPWPQETSTAG